MDNLAHLPDFLGHRQTLGTPPKSAWFDGSPVPWISYPAICFLEQLSFAGLGVFEYGSGASTLYWAARARAVTSVEHDEDWFHRGMREKPGNVELYLARERDYVETVRRNAPHDIIVVDGRWRPDCARFCPDYLKYDGFLIVDNSERDPAMTQSLRDRGLIQIDFIGHGPINATISATSLFLTRSVRFTPRAPGQPRYLPGMHDAADKPPDGV